MNLYQRMLNTTVSTKITDYDVDFVSSNVVKVRAEDVLVFVDNVVDKYGPSNFIVEPATLDDAIDVMEVILFDRETPKGSSIYEESAKNWVNYQKKHDRVEHLDSIKGQLAVFYKKLFFED